MIEIDLRKAVENTAYELAGEYKGEEYENAVKKINDLLELQKTVIIDIFYKRITGVEGGISNEVFVELIKGV